MSKRRATDELYGDSAKVQSMLLKFLDGGVAAVLFTVRI